MLFAQEQTKSVWAELKECVGPEERVSLGYVVKAVGERWRGLTEEERQQYKERSAKELQDEVGLSI